MNKTAIAILIFQICLTLHVFAQKAEYAHAVTDTIYFSQVGGKADNLTDNSPILVGLLKTINHKKSVILFDDPDKVYLFKSTVVISGIKFLNLVGNAVKKPKFKFTSETMIGIRIENSSEILVENIHFIGSGEKRLGVNAAALKIVRSTRITVNSCIIQNGITNGIEGFLSDSCIVSNNTVFGTKNYNGIGWAGGYYNMFKWNTCYNNRGQGIELRSVHFATVDGNVCFNNGEFGEQSLGITIECEDGSFPVGGYRNGVGSVYNASVYTGFSDGELVRIKMGSEKPSEYITFVTNTKNDSLTAFKLLSDVNSKANSLQKMPYKGTTEELLDIGSSNVVVSNNIVSNNKGYGIYLVSSRRDKLEKVTIENNIISNNESSGIFVTTYSENKKLVRTKNITISNNIITNNGIEKNKWFIWLDHVDSIFVNKNIVSGNGQSDKMGLNGVLNSVFK